MYQKQEVRRYLDEKGIAYQWVEHPAVYTIEDLLALNLEDVEGIAKNLFLRDAKGKRHFLVVVQGEKAVNLAELGVKLEAGKLSFASEQRLEKYLGLKKGSVTPLGILNDTEHVVEVIFDEAILKQPTIGIHPNENTASVYLSASDLIELIKKEGNPVRTISLS